VKRQNTEMKLSLVIMLFLQQQCVRLDMLHLVSKLTKQPCNLQHVHIK